LASLLSLLSLLFGGFSSFMEGFDSVSP
jgi:hypothetical protein